MSLVHLLPLKARQQYKARRSYSGWLHMKRFELPQDRVRDLRQRTIAAN
jgi:hypothetical protein